jgi:hypothetical protein
MIELLIVMSACSVVLTLSSVVIVRAMRVQMQARAYCDAERNALRLSDQFRRDVHGAKSAVSRRADPEGDSFLRLQLADGRQVDYSRVGGTVLRLTTGNGNRVAREEFAFPADCELGVRESQSPRRLVLTISADPDFDLTSGGTPLRVAPAGPLSLHVEAAVGRDLRLAAAAQHDEASP